MKAEDLRPFCSTDPIRPGLLEPFTDDEHTYATDGKIMIRVPAIGGIKPRQNQPTNPGKLIPPRDGMYPVELPPGWQKFTAPILTCKDCDGAGHYTECWVCDGEGENECCECGNIKECTNCQGYGRLPDHTKQGTQCDECDGQGQYEGEFAVSLNRGACAVTLRYLRLIHTLPGARLYYRNALSPLRIEFENGDGVVVPNRTAENRGVPIIDQWLPETVTAP